MQTTIPPEEKSLQQTVNSAKIISFALMSSIFMLGLILKLKGDLQFDFELMMSNLASNPIAQVLTLMGFVCFAMHMAIPKLISKSAGPGQPLVQKFITKHILKLAFLEAMAISGFMLALLTHEATTYVSFASLAIAMIAASLPDRSSLRNHSSLPRQ